MVLRAIGRGLDPRMSLFLNPKKHEAKPKARPKASPKAIFFTLKKKLASQSWVN
jgi:hypothetical protein